MAIAALAVACFFEKSVEKKITAHSVQGCLLTEAFQRGNGRRTFKFLGFSPVHRDWRCPAPWAPSE